MTETLDSQIRCWGCCLLSPQETIVWCWHVQLCRRESLSRTFYESFGNWRHHQPANGNGNDRAKREAYEKGKTNTRRAKDMNIREREKCEFAQYFQILCRCWIRQQRAPSLKVLLWCLEAIVLTMELLNSTWHSHFWMINFSASKDDSFSFEAFPNGGPGWGV